MKRYNRAHQVFIGGLLMRFKLDPACAFAATTLTLCIVAGCGGGASSTKKPLTLSVGATKVIVPQDGSQAPLAVTIGGPIGAATVSVSGLPTGVTEQFVATSGGQSGTLTFTENASVAAGNSTVTITAVVGSQSATQTVTLTSAPVATVAATVDTTLGVKGKLAQFMATSFQIFQYTGDIFGSGSTATAREATLTNLAPQHVRLQLLGGAFPMVSNTGAASDWDFTLLDQIVQPVLASADHSPEFQIATAPAWMCDSHGYLDVANHVNDFAAFAANLVRYYNTGGFTVGTTHFQSPSAQTITWWGVFNEYNINGLTAAQYVTLYNTVVPAMLAVDPTIKLSALELSDYGMGTGDAGDPTLALPTFLAPAVSGGVKTQVDVMSTHFYGTCNQTDTDAKLFANIQQFTDDVNYFYKELATRPDLDNPQVWVTENNVNADYATSDGMSTCNPSQKFVTDQRGTSAFFAAWRPTVFSQLGKAGNRALYHWDYSADLQYGEVDSKSNPYLSYWVDRTLANFYPSTTAAPGPDILTLTSTESSSIETMATRNSDGSVRVMVVDRAVHAAADNNGAGDPRTVVVDTSALGNFSAASLLIIDTTTNVTNGPAGTSVTPGPRVNVTLNGYGVAFLTLTP